jgi:hypothetical protein
LDLYEYVLFGVQQGLQQSRGLAPVFLLDEILRGSDAAFGRPVSGESNGVSEASILGLIHG